MAATEELVDLCEISSDDEVLEVGCGVGQTAVWLAQRIGCRVVGVDNLQAMVERARERAESAGVCEITEFRVADIIDLQFEDNRFDAVFGESITVFATDHAKAVKDYAGVVKPGGFVGINETTWLQPPSPELEAWLSQDMSANATTHMAEEWEGLLKNAGLKDLIVRISTIETREEALGSFRRYGCGGFLRIVGRVLRLYLRDPEYREFARETREGGIIPENAQDYIGYGLYIGRKP
jgi:ubiquinone/menaquinone biosynthesis C-methylase UbiE